MLQFTHDIIRNGGSIRYTEGINIEVMWLLRRLTTDLKSISDFRKDNKEAINLVFKQFVALCKEWDLLKDKAHRIRKNAANPVVSTDYSVFVCIYGFGVDDFPFHQ